MNALSTRLTADQHRHQPRTPAPHLVPLSSRPDPYWAPVVIRLATAGDQRSLERLAQLDSSPAPVGDTVIGELQGRPVVAVALSDGQVVADPFLPTRQIQELVALRTEQLKPRSRFRPSPARRGR